MRSQMFQCRSVVDRIRKYSSIDIAHYLHYLVFAIAQFHDDVIK